jgi:signal transduction histidine kinase
VAAPVLAALLVDVAVNATLVTIGVHLFSGLAPSAILREMTGGQEQRYFLTGYLAFGLLALLLATVHLQAGLWSPVAFGVPLFLARRMFVYWKRAGEASADSLNKQRALIATTERIVDERREERLAMAADIHDEVLQPLYQVHLMGQVLKQDLASGRLLQLEEDLPELLRAADAANGAIRQLLRETRDSPLGARGLGRTLELLAEQLGRVTDAAIDLDIGNIDGSPLAQLVVYQIAREALTNAARHADASTIRLSLRVADGHLRLVVRDDGHGLRSAAISRSHFGLDLMRERAEMIGGTLVIDSSPEGVTVVASIPLVPLGHSWGRV